MIFFYRRCKYPKLLTSRPVRIFIVRVSGREVVVVPAIVVPAVVVLAAVSRLGNEDVLWRRKTR
jgi:hypothetical protein